MEKIKAKYEEFQNLNIIAKILFVIVLILIVLYFIAVSKKGGDFASYLEAADKMIHGANIYEPPYIHLRYSYSPFWAMVLTPLTVFPSYVGVFIWLIINVFLLRRTIFLLRNYFDIRYEDTKADGLLWVLIILFMSRFIELNFHHSQMTIFLLWCILECVKLCGDNKEVNAGILIGLGTIIKIMPIVMIPYFLYRKKFKAAIVSVITTVVTFFLPIIFLGINKFVELNRTWFQILRPDNSDFHWDITDYFSHNLSSLLYRLLMKTDAPYIKNILSLDYSTATKIIWSVIVLLIVFTTYFLATLPFKEVKSRKHILYEISYITILMPLIFPHQMKYAFYFMLPAICCLIKFIIDSYQIGDVGLRFKSTVTFVVLSFILCIMTTDLLLGMNYSITTQYLKTITIGTLLLIPALALNKRYFVGD